MRSFLQPLLWIFISCCSALVVSVFATAAIADDGLTISISTDNAIDSIPAIDIDKPFRVVIKNNTDKEIRIWHPFSRQGYYGLTFEAKNLTTGEIFLTTKRQIDDDAYFKALAEHMEPGSNPVTIQPNDTYTTQVELIDYAWGQLEWIGIPEPNTDARYSIQARYHSPSTDVDGEGVWTGKITGDPLEVLIVSARIDTPHEYLWNHLPNLAMRVMKNDSGWINRRDEDQRTPLHVAARFMHLEVVKWLLDNGADVNAIAYNGFTPLHLTGDPEVVKLILEYDPDLSISCRIQGQTPLQRAVENLSGARKDEEKDQWRSIIDMYLASGADYDIITAIYRDDLDRVKAIMSDSPALDDGFYNNSPLRRAASLGRLEICQYLIDEHKVDVNQFKQGSGYPIIKNALAHPETVRLLIENGADLEKRITWQGGRSGVWIIGDHATILHFAAARGVPETVELLIEAGVDIFATSRSMFDEEESAQTALDVAAYFGRAENTEAIVNHEKFEEADADVRQKLLDRCLRAAVFSSWLAPGADRPRLLNVLLNKGADAELVDENGVTAVQITARQIHPTHEVENKGHKELISILLKYGATLDLFTAVAIGDETAVTRILKNDPEFVDALGPDGYPALHFAVSMNFRNIVKLLLDAGADVNIRNESEGTGTKGGSPLHSAAFWGRDEIAKLLIDSGADVNARGEKESTPLHNAARMTNVRMTRLLLENGAVIDAKDSDGETALDWCRDLNWTNADEIKKIFREYLDN